MKHAEFIKGDRTGREHRMHPSFKRTGQEKWKEGQLADP